MAAATVLLGVLLAESEDTVSVEFKGALQGKLREVLNFCVSSIVGALATPAGGLGCDPRAAFRLCKFLASIAEVDELCDLLSPQDATNVAQSVALTHPGSEDVQNCARWLWWLVSPGRLLPDLKAAVADVDAVLPVRAALWAITDLSKRKRLPDPQAFLPWVLRAMVGAHGSDDRVQLHGAAALLALCRSESVDVVACEGEIGAALEHALTLHMGNWEVAEKLLETSAWTIGLKGHVHFLCNRQITSDPSLLKVLLCDLGLGKRLVISPREVGCDALVAVLGAVEASSGDMSHPMMCALWGLLERASKLAPDNEPLLLQGAEIVVKALAQTIQGCQATPSWEFLQASFSIVHLLASSHSPTITQALREHRHIVKDLLEATVEPSRMRYHEMETCCRLVVALWSIADLVSLVERRASTADVTSRDGFNGFLQAACTAINDAAYEGEEVQPCATAVMRLALEFLRTLTPGECVLEMLSAPAGTLGVAIAHLGTDSASQELITLALQRLLGLTNFAVELSSSGYHLLHNTLWAMREAASYCKFARTWLLAQPQALRLLLQAVQSLVEGSNGQVPADQHGGDAKRALTEGLSTLTLLQGPSLAVLAMTRCPGSRALQAAGCAALRDAAQQGLLSSENQEVKVALLQACRICENEPEVESVACMALGLLGG